MNIYNASNHINSFSQTLIIMMIYFKNIKYTFLRTVPFVPYSKMSLSVTQLLSFYSTKGSVRNRWSRTGSTVGLLPSVAKCYQQPTTVRGRLQKLSEEVLGVLKNS